MHTGPPLRDIACFVRVADQGGFSRAAARLGMSQPAVSQAVARLEATLGVRLFERTSREVWLTDAGKVLLPHAEALLAQASTFAAEAHRLAVPSGRAIRLAYCPLVGTLAARVARRLARRSPPVEVVLEPAGWSSATALLGSDRPGTALLGTDRTGTDRTGAVPLGTDRPGAAGAPVTVPTTVAVMTVPFPAGVATTARFALPVTHLAVPSGSPFAGAPKLRLAQVGRHALLVPRGLAGQAALRGYRSRLPLRDLDDLPAALDLVAAGQGLLPVPGLLVDTVRRPDVRFVPLDGAGLRLTYGLAWRSEQATAELMALVQTVREVLRSR